MPYLEELYHMTLPGTSTTAGPIGEIYPGLLSANLAFFLRLIPHVAGRFRVPWSSWTGRPLRLSKKIDERRYDYKIVLLMF